MESPIEHLKNWGQKYLVSFILKIKMCMESVLPDEETMLWLLQLLSVHHTVAQETR